MPDFSVKKFDGLKSANNKGGLFTMKQFDNPSKQSYNLEPATYDIAQAPIYGEHPLYTLLQDPSGSTQAYNKAKNQSGLDQFGNFLGQSATTIIGETLSGLGATYEIAKLLTTEDDDFNNLLIEAGEGLQQWGKDVMPIHQKNPYQTFQLQDRGWWLQNGTSIVSTLGLLIPAGGQVKALGYLGKLGKFAKLSSRAANIAGKGNMLTKLISKIPNASYRTTQLTKSVLTAGLMRNAENMSESFHTYNDVYNLANEQMSKMDDTTFEQWKQDNGKLTEEQKLMDKDTLARDIASTAGWDTYKTNSVNFVFDLIQTIPLFKPFKFKAAVKSTSSRLASKQSELLGKTTNILSKGQRNIQRAKVAGIFGLEAGSEGVEEFINAVGSSEGLYYGKLLLGQTNESDFSDRLNDYLHDPHAWEQAFWGTVGGAGFQGGIKGYNTINDLVGNTNSRRNSRNRISEVESRGMTINMFAGLQKGSNEGYKVFDETGRPLFHEREKFTGTPEEIENKINAQNDIIEGQMMTNMALNAVNVGNMDLLTEYVESDNFKTILKEQYGVEDSEINHKVARLKGTVKDVGEMYEGLYNKMYNKPFTDGVKDILIRSSVRHMQQAKDLQKESNKIKSRIAKYKSNDATYLNYKSQGIDHVINYYANTATINQIDEMLSEEENFNHKRILERQAIPYRNQLAEQKDLAIKSIKDNPALNNIFKDKAVIESLKTIIGDTNTANLLDFGSDVRIDFADDATTNETQGREITRQITNAEKQHKQQIVDTLNEEMSKINVDDEKWSEKMDDIESQIRDQKKKGINIKPSDVDTIKARRKLKNDQSRKDKINKQEKAKEDINKQKEEDTTTQVTPQPQQSEESDDIKAIKQNAYEQLDNSIIQRKDVLNEEYTEQEKKDFLKEYYQDLIKTNKTNVVLVNKIRQLIKDIDVVEEQSKTPPEESSDPIINFSITSSDVSFDENKDSDNGAHLYIQSLKKANKRRNENQNIVINDKQKVIFGLKEGDKVTIKVDVDNITNRPAHTKEDIAIGIYKNGEHTGTYFQTQTYLEDELKFIQKVQDQLDEFTDEEVEGMIKHLRSIKFAPEYSKQFKEAKDDKKIVSLYTGVGQRQGFESIDSRDLKHIVRVLTFGFSPFKDYQKGDIKASVNSWKAIIEKDLEYNKYVRDFLVGDNQLKDIDPKKTIEGEISYVTAGNTVISRRNSKVIVNPIKDIIGENNNDIYLYGADTNNTKRLIPLDGRNLKTLNSDTSYSHGGEYLRIDTNQGRFVSVPLYRTKLNGNTYSTDTKIESNFDNKDNEDIRNYVIKSVKDLLSLLQSNPDVSLSDKQVTDIKDSLGKLVLINLRNEEEKTYFKIYKAGIDENKKHYSARIEIGPVNKVIVYAKEDGFDVYVDGKLSDNSATDLRKAVDQMIRNVDRKALASSDTYTNPANNKTYSNYKDFILSSNAIVTDLNKIVDEQGKFVSYFTVYTEDNNYRESGRPMMINVKPLVEKKAKTIVEKLVEKGNFVNVMTSLKANETELKLAQIADEMNVGLVHTPYQKINKDTAIILADNMEAEVPLQALGGYVPDINQILLFDKLNTSNVDIKETILHETIHGIVHNRGMMTGETYEEISKFSKEIVDLFNNTNKNTIYSRIFKLLNITSKTEQNDIKIKLREMIEQVERVPEEVITYGYSNDYFKAFLATNNGVKKDGNKKSQPLVELFKDLVKSIIKRAADMFNIEFSKLDELDQILSNFTAPGKEVEVGGIKYSYDLGLKVSEENNSENKVQNILANIQNITNLSVEERMKECK